MEKVINGILYDTDNSEPIHIYEFPNEYGLEQRESLMICRDKLPYLYCQYRKGTMNEYTEEKRLLPLEIGNMIQFLIDTKGTEHIEKIFSILKDKSV